MQRVYCLSYYLK